jgi:hypothetical protein
MKAIIRQINKDVDDMNSLINEMNYELSKFGPNSRTSMANRIKQYKLDIEIIQKDLVSLCFKRIESFGVVANYNSFLKKKATSDATKTNNYDTYSQTVNVSLNLFQY